MESPILASLVILVAALPAQGTYRSYGTGCAGTGGCAATNPGLTRLANAVQNSNTFAVAVPAPARSTVVFGFELYLRATSVPVTLQTHLYLADRAGKPLGAPVRSGTMRVGTTAGWYKTTFSRLVVIRANTRYALSYTPQPGRAFYPFFAAGEMSVSFWRPPTSAAWTGPVPGLPWGYKVTCAASRTAVVLSNAGVPTLGTVFRVELSRARTHAPVILALGLSDRRAGAARLPFDLTPWNARGCFLRSSWEWQLRLRTDAAGRASFQFAVPNNPILKGVKFYNQYVVDDPAANGLGLVTTNGGVGTIG